MRRREFISLLGAAATAWPVATHAQKVGKLPTIGVLGADATVWSPWTAALTGRLNTLGWIENRNVTFEYRWSEGRPERVAEIATEFVQQNVDVIVAPGSAVAALKHATTVIPIVFAVAVDPVGGGLVSSLARPGGNVTGLSVQQPDLVGKRLELLREVVPKLRRLAVLSDAGYRDSVRETGDVQTAAQTLALEVALHEIRRPDEIGPAFEALNQTDALYVVSDALIAANRTRIITFALSARLPTIFSYREYVQAGGLMSYGANFEDMFRHTADIVDKILRGTKPSDIPVEQPTKFDLVLNRTTAKAIGITIPGTVLARADEVIE